ncbi:ComEC/Rec2 family competence protein [Psychrobacter sp. CAL346-MNA-CIBAN-0220]|uniref:ComEC/Rec2 family competence protein n=1 Tax=Psychrobacter sp. CAL346-MNA-CIBAN-0220 TaxID=3140457 RepID=UPI0033338292
MYWWVSILIITAMTGVLAVADSTLLPISPLLASMTEVSVWPVLLSIVAAILMFITQRKALFSSLATISPTLPQNSSPILRFTLSVIGYLSVILLAVILIIGSALQALSSHQRAENQQVNESMRIKALVTIEGVSDSVYDPATNSGYRQVATIQSISPLVSYVSAQDLDAAAVKYINNHTNNYTDNNLDRDHTQSLGHRVLLNAYPKNSNKNTKLTAVNELQPGNQLFMTLKLAPLASSQEAINNPSGFDSYRWLRGRHIDGVATIITMGTSFGNIAKPSSLITTDSTSYFKRLRTRIDQWRWQLRQHFYQDWSSQTTAQQQANAVTLSLLTGDRSLINRDTKDLYQLAGISHLLAISGTHVLFLAIMLAGAAVLLVNQLRPTLYRYLSRWQIRWMVMISAAFIYALFTGFDVPAARTAWMLLAIGAVRLTLLPVTTMRVLLALAVLMAWFDPYVLWQAGYWLSFIAVALLLKYDEALYRQAENNATNRQQNKDTQKRRTFYTKIWSLFKRVFKLQCWLFIALLPITLLLFGKASLWGLVINLFAIGLFGWVIVPLNLLAGLCYLLLPAGADSIWTLVSAIVASLHELITWLTTLPALQSAWLYTPMNMGMLLMGLLILLPWLLPRGLISRWLALPPLALLMMTITANQQTLSSTPTLYILPTGDRYLSAVLLQYPVNNRRVDDNNKSLAINSVSWLFLADHRPQGRRNMPSSLTADKLSAILEQQLRTLSAERLDGIIVQTSVAVRSAKQKRNRLEGSASALLPMTVAQLSQNLPTSQYWQAGRSGRLAANKQTYLQINQSNDKAIVSAQRCEQGKTWQLANNELSLQVLTGWSKIDDASVWGCAVAIDSDKPIKVMQYNAADPSQSQLLLGQRISGQGLSDAITPLDKTQKSNQIERNQSRVVLDVATHQRVWQMWSLLCTAKPFAINNAFDHYTTWLSHSTSQVSTDILRTQRVGKVITYDNKSLDVAFVLTREP